MNNKNDNTFKAILTLKNDGKSNIKFFNLSSKYKSLALGFRQFGKIQKVPLSVKDASADFSLSGIDDSRSFTCAVVDVTTAFQPEIILSASQNSSSEMDHIEDAFVSPKVEDTSKLYTPATDEEIERVIDENLEHDRVTTYFDSCAKCRYRQAFYEEGDASCHNCSEESGTTSEKVTDEEVTEGAEMSAPTHDEIKSPSEDIKTLSSEEKDSAEKILSLRENLDFPQDEDITFYERIKPQIDALFEKYDRDERLETLLPTSSWVKVTYDDDGGYYVLGLIREDDEVKYISYGMPSGDENTPPDDLSSLSQYLKLGENDGYWIVCQDALNGKTMRVKIVQ